MQHIGDLDGTPVYLCDGVVVPSDRPDTIEQTLLTRVAKAKAAAIVMTPAQLQALDAEYVATQARHQRAVARAEALGRPAPAAPPAPMFVPVDDSDLIDEDPVEGDLDDLFDDQKYPDEMPADPAADTQPIDTATE